MPTSNARARFAARFRVERLAAGLTQEALGIRAGVNADVARTRINRYERAVHDCDVETAQRISDVLAIPLAALYADSDRMAEIIKIFASLEEHEQEAAIGLIRNRAWRDSQ